MSAPTVHPPEERRRGAIAIDPRTHDLIVITTRRRVPRGGRGPGQDPYGLTGRLPIWHQGARRHAVEVLHPKPPVPSWSAILAAVWLELLWPCCLCPWSSS